ncbi:MAG: tripartite tricarboxylate transporter substrate binding protein [Geminicoccaceae bacterium]
MSKITLGLALTSAIALSSPALAAYPEQPIQLIIAYGAGGATDLSGRALATALGPKVPQPILPVNRTGAGGATGTASVAAAEPDGYTMVVARVGSHTVNPAMKDTLPYTLDDFDFVAVYEINPVACAVAADSDIDSMETLAARVNENPGTISYSSSGVGSLLHIAGAMALRSFGVENPVEAAIHLPMAGGGEAATAVLAGTADFICTNSSALSSFVANGQLRPLMVTTAEPVAGFDAPTSADLGKPELESLVGWSGIAGPAGLPDEVIETWRGWLVEAIEDPGFQETMDRFGSIVDLKSPEESVAFINEQYRIFRELVDELGMRVE